MSEPFDGRPVGEAFNDPRVPCCGRDAADCDCGEQPTEQELEDFLTGFLEAGLWADLQGICPYCKQRARDAGDGDHMICDDADCQRRHRHDGKVSVEFGAGNEWPEWIDEIADETREKYRAECADFLSANLANVRYYCTVMGDWHGSDGSCPAAMARAGHDFWLTRNGHGAGFWDRPSPMPWRIRDWLRAGNPMPALVAMIDAPRAAFERTCKRLTDECRPYGSAELYVGDDGMVYA